MFEGHPYLAILDDIAFTLPEDRAVLEAVWTAGGMTNKWELYEVQRRRGGYRGVRSVAGSLNRLAERGFIHINNKMVTETVGARVIHRQRIEVNEQGLREEASRATKQLSLF